MKTLRWKAKYTLTLRNLSKLPWALCWEWANHAFENCKSEDPTLTAKDDFYSSWMSKGSDERDDSNETKESFVKWLCYVPILAVMHFAAIYTSNVLITYMAGVVTGLQLAWLVSLFSMWVARKCV